MACFMDTEQIGDSILCSSCTGSCQEAREGDIQI